MERLKRCSSGSLHCITVVQRDLRQIPHLATIHHLPLLEWPLRGINFDTAIGVPSRNPKITTADQAQGVAKLLRFTHVTTLTARLHMCSKRGRGFETPQAADTVMLNTFVSAGLEVVGNQLQGRIRAASAHESANSERLESRKVSGCR